MPTQAQKMKVENFVKVKKGPFNIKKIEIDKENAILDLTTAEKGFQFKADGKTDINAEEGDNVITLKIPDKTKFLLITHPDYGQLLWNAQQKKGLRKKKRYKANLLTFDPDKKYEVKNQWVVFDINPKNAILQVDSNTIITRTGKVQMQLPVGKHQYKVTSPFYDECNGEVEVIDSLKKEVKITLMAAYSYITVRIPKDSANIYIDNIQIGKTGDREATSGHIKEGRHRLTVLKDKACFYDAFFNIGKAEKKTVNIPEKIMTPSPWKDFQQPRLVIYEPADETFVYENTQQATADNSSDSIPAKIQQPLLPIEAQVTISVADSTQEIWVDRQKMGIGKWSGTLKEGYHIVNTKKDTTSSANTFFLIKDNMPVEIKLGITETSFGTINVHGNVMEADIHINGKFIGKTPLIIQNLNAKETYSLMITKKGYKKVKKKVKPAPNSMTDVSFKLKKQKINIINIFNNIKK